MKNFFHFLQYHNFALLALVVLLGFGGTIFAANEIVQTIGEEKAINTLALLGADLDSFDMEMSILSAEEGETEYNIVYTFRTLSIVDNEWQVVDKEGSMKIAKTSLLGTDLETYAFKQLSEIVEQERNYLRKAQAYERSFAENSTPLSKLKGLSLGALKSISEKGKAFVPQPDVVVEEKDLEEDDAATSSSTPASDTALATSTASSTPDTTSTPTQTGSSTTPAVVEGCLDSTATNYNAQATEDDGSCEFPPEEPVTPPAPQSPPVEQAPTPANPEPTPSTQ